MLDDWLSDKPVIPGAKGIAVIWRELSAAAALRGRPRPVNDTWVAACCIAYDLPLATLNVNTAAAPGHAPARHGSNDPGPGRSRLPVS